MLLLIWGSGGRLIHKILVLPYCLCENIGDIRSVPDGYVTSGVLEVRTC